MNVWLVTVGEPLPTDPGSPRLWRCGAFARYLAAQGHGVVWWTSAFDHFSKTHRVRTRCRLESEGVAIELLPGPGYRSNVSPSRILEHWQVARGFRRAATRMMPPDIIVCALPTIELSYEAVRYGERFGVPVLIDVRDLWPEVMFDAFPPLVRPVARLGLFWLEWMANQSLRRCTGIIGLSETYLNWGLRRARRSRRDTDGIFPIGYEGQPATDAELQEAGEKLAESGVDPSKRIAWFVGSISRQFDFQPILRAAEALLTQGRTDIQFVISGSGDRLDSLRKQARGLPNVVFTLWIGRPELVWMSEHAQVGLQPYAADVRVGLANKLFEYLNAGLPIVSSLRGENEAVLETHRCGLTYRIADTGDLVTKLLEILDDPALRETMSANAKRLFESRYAMPTIQAALTAHLERVNEIARST